jgi:hypothetical protein
MSDQGVRISDSSALRLFTDSRMSTIANCIVRHYLEGTEPVVPESFLNKLYDFEEKYPRATIDLRNFHVENKELCILDPEMAATFVKYHKKKDDWSYEESLEDEESGSLESLEDEENERLTPLEENRDDESRQGSMKSRKWSQDTFDELCRQVHNPKQERSDSEDGGQAYKRRRLD